MKLSVKAYYLSYMEYRLFLKRSQLKSGLKNISDWNLKLYEEKVLYVHRKYNVWYVLWYKVHFA